MPNYLRPRDVTDIIFPARAMYRPEGTGAACRMIVIFTDPGVCTVINPSPFDAKGEIPVGHIYEGMDIMNNSWIIDPLSIRSANIGLSIKEYLDVLSPKLEPLDAPISTPTPILIPPRFTNPFPKLERKQAC